MAEFLDILNRYSPQITELLGNIADLRAVNSYGEAMGELGQMQQQADQLKKFYDINRRIMQVDETKIPQTKDVPEYEFDAEHSLNYNFDDPLIKPYYDYAKNFMTANAGKTPKTATEFYNENPKLREQLMQVHPEIFKQSTKKVTLTPEEYRAEFYKSAGLGPEDAAFYEKTKNDIYGQVNTYNAKLQNLLMQFYPNLVSTGKKGDFYAQLFGKQLENRMFQPPQDAANKWVWKYENGKLVGYDEKGNVKFKDVGPDKEQEKFYEKIGYRITPVQDKDGNTKYMYEVPTKDGWKPNGLEATKDQYDAWQTQLENKELSYEDKKNIDASFRIGNRGHRRGSFNLTIGEDEDFNDIKNAKNKQKMADKYFGGDLEKLKEAQEKIKGMTTKDAKKYFDTLSKTQSTPKPKTEETKGYSSQKYQDYVGNLEKHAQNKNEKQALTNVKTWFSDTIKQWGRADLTADEWRKEIAQEQWTDLEWAIIQQVFKDNFGEEL